MAKAGLTHDVFVANLPAHADQQAVRNLFSCFGEIEGVHLKNGKRGDGSKIAFLHFLRQTDANQAVEKQNGITWDGHTLLVQKSTKKDASKDQENKGEKCERKGKKQNKKNNVIGKKESGSLNSFKKKSTESKPALEEYTVLGTSDDALIVVHIEDPTVFYAQRVDLNPQLSDISKQLSKVCSQTVSVQGTPEMFKVYGAQFSEDQLWYRCEIMKNNIPGQCTVQYIDFGNREVISNKRIVELPDNLASVPPLAFKCQFKGLRGPMKDTENQQFQKGLQFLRKLTEGHIVYARLHPSPPGIKTVCCLLINCFVNGINLGQELIKNGYAFEVDDTEMSKTNAYSDCKDTKPLCGKKVKQGHWGRKNASRQQVSQDSSSLNSQFEKFGITKNIVGTKLNDQLGLIPPGDSGYNSGSNHSQFGVGDQFQNNVMIEHSASEEIKRLKAERDYLLRELTWEKEKLQAMKNELEKKTTDDISKKFTVILEKASKIKSLRCQLIYEKEQPDIIDLSISTVQNFQKDLASSNDKGVQEAVLEAHKTYNTCQAKLRSSTNKDEVQSLIEDRDSARRRFHEEIKQFLNSVSHQPNGERTTLLKALLSDLNKFYQPYLKMTCTGTVFLPLEEVASIYGNMKSQKQEEVQEVRRHTDAAGKKVSETLHVFHQLMIIEEPHTDTVQIQGRDNITFLDSVLQEPSQNTSKVEFLSKSLDDYIDSLNMEIKVCDMENGSESALLAVVTQILHKELNYELQQMQDLEKLKTQYSNFMKELSPWLNNKPDTSQIIATRKIIRKLKSKLRHKIADKNDIEENEEKEKEALENINNELAALRKELHEAFSEESKLLEDLAELQEFHFPELDIQNPELGISNSVEFHGLLKQGWELDHFLLEKSSSSQSVLTYRSTFGGSEVIIKEYFMDNVQQKTEFLQKAVEYRKSACDNLVPLHAVFFSKNERQGYTVSPCPSNTLFYKVKNCPLLLKDRKILLLGVLKGLEALHSHDIVHGALHPFDIFYKLDGSGIIDLPDLSRNEAQKLANGKFPVNGICFQCPEAVHKGVLTEQSDMYSFGCLMLWLMFSTVKFNETLTGIPDLSTLNMDVKSSTEYSIICSLLLQQASERPTVQDLLKASYFTLADSEESTIPEKLEMCNISCIDSDILTSISVGEDSTSVIEEHPSSESDLMANSDFVLRNRNNEQVDNGSKDVEPEYEVAAALNALKESIGEVLSAVESSSFPSVNKCGSIHIMNSEKMSGGDFCDKDDFIEDYEGGDSEERNQRDAKKEVEIEKCENSEVLDNSN